MDEDFEVDINEVYEEMITFEEDGAPSVTDASLQEQAKKVSTSSFFADLKSNLRKNFVIHGIDDDVTIEDVIKSVEISLCVSPSVAIQAIGFDTRRISGKRSLEIQFFQESYKTFFLNNGIKIRDRVYGPFLPRSGTIAYIPNLPLYIPRNFLMNELKRNQIKVIKLRQRRLNKYPYLRTKEWNLTIENDSKTIKNINIKGYNYRIIYFGQQQQQ